MDRILMLGLVACCARLAVMLLKQPSDLYENLILAPAIGLIACVLLIIIALGAFVRPAREFNDAGSNEGSDV